MVKMQNSLQVAKNCAFGVVEMRLDAEIRKSESIASFQWVKTCQSRYETRETTASQSKGMVCEV
jgi:hypothetical protein